jgi:hypothetical protein
MEHDMHGGSDAARNWVVFTVPRCVKWVASHETPERLFVELAEQFIWNFSEDCATKDAEFRRVWLYESEKCLWYTTRRSNRTTECAIVEVDDYAYRA